MGTDLNTPDSPLWTPDSDARIATAMGRFFRAVRSRHATAPDPLAPYAEWHRWSVENTSEFWSEIWHLCDIVGNSPDDATSWISVLDDGERMQPPSIADGARGPRWFRGARLNYAENLLRHTGGAAAIIAIDERGRRRDFGIVRGHG